MKILVVSENIPKPNFSSGDRRFLGILEILVKNHEVIFCIPPRQPWLDKNKKETEDAISYIREMGINFLPVNQGLYKKTIVEEKYDIGFFEFYWTAEKFMGSFIARQSQAVTIVDSVDLHFAREETQARLGQISERKVRITRLRELTTYRLADIVIAVSKEDQQRLENETGIQHLALIANVVPTVKRENREREPSLLFIGCYAWPPNVDAMKWFVDKVWPLITKEEEKAKLWIVGSRPPQEITAMSSIPGVEVLGFVPDTRPYLDSAAISIAPLRYGGGMKGKVNEAFAHGLPVVSTSIGAQGFNATNGIEMFIADEPGRFAGYCLELLKNQELQIKMGQAGQRLNEKICSPEVIEANINQMLGHCFRLRSGTKRKIGRRKLWKLKINRIRAGLYK